MVYGCQVRHARNHGGLCHRRFQPSDPSSRPSACDANSCGHAAPVTDLILYARGISIWLCISPSRRLRRTPFSDGVEAAGVKAYTVYNRMLLPTVFESVEADYHHSQDRCAGLGCVG